MAHKQDAHIMDILAVCIPLFHSIARIGCFFGGCCFGLESHGHIAINYTTTVFNEAITAYRIPTQLIEAAFNFCLFLYLLHLFRDEYWESKKILRRYLLLYSIGRFVILNLNISLQDLTNMVIGKLLKNLSFDYMAGDDGDEDKLDKSRILSETCTYMETEDETEKEMLDRILWFLTDIQREVYRLVKIVGHTQTEAADILGTSIPNINKHLKKAMDRIEEQKEKM